MIPQTTFVLTLRPHIISELGGVFYSFLKKFPTYTFIQSYTFISFPEKNPTYTFIRTRCLFGTLE